MVEMFAWRFLCAFEDAGSIPRASTRNDCAKSKTTSYLSVSSLRILTTNFISIMLSDVDEEGLSPAALSLVLDASNALELSGSIELISQLIEVLRRTSLLTTLSVGTLGQLQQQTLTALENATKRVTVSKTLF